MEHALKEIAFQAGVSLATVDRVVHGRRGVRETTRMRVQAAIAELSRQKRTAAAHGQRFGIDVVMEAPGRFTSEVRRAFEEELPALRPASLRCRFHVAEEIPEPEIVALLRQIRKRGSHGVVLKAPDTAAIGKEIDFLAHARIPVVTLVTDHTSSKRIAYVGMDNHKAGMTAAYFIDRFLPKEPAKVLVALSSEGFRGEEQRLAGFEFAMKSSEPAAEIIKVSEAFGGDQRTGAQVQAALAANPDINAVYSIGGGNRAIIDAFRAEHRHYAVFIAHDLDADNVPLLKLGDISVVLHHDLRRDARAACQLILKKHRLLPASLDVPESAIGIATPVTV